LHRRRRHLPSATSSSSSPAASSSSPTTPRWAAALQLLLLHVSTLWIGRKRKMKSKGSSFRLFHSLNFRCRSLPAHVTPAQGSY
jgi:hypothetical protein